MVQFLADEQVWKELQNLSKKRKRRLFAAVPYVGADTKELLRFRSGDVMVVALTEANARCGSVCPDEIGRLQRKGVEVFLAPDLHAKVVLCGNKAVVGSANLSKASFKYRDEAAIVTTDPVVVRSVREWFDQRVLEPVTPEWLSVCAKAYRPPKVDGPVRGRGAAKKSRMGRGVWLIGLEPTEFPEDEIPLQERGEAAAEKQIKNRAKYEVTSSRIVGSKRMIENIRRGDSWITVWKDGKQHYAEEPRRVVGWRRVNKTDKFITYYYTESSRRPKKVAWRTFKQECLRSGLKLGSGVACREVTNPLQAARILKLVSKRMTRA